ncbi:MAG: SDR family oxidoreductase [Bacteroidales bacterium]|nr:SDR family oxidoreductase [Bacteroidales bacterium]
MTLFQDKIIWITGASSGIGRSLSLQFFKLGAKLVLSGRNQDALHSVAKEANVNKDRFLILDFDLSTDFDANEKAQKVIEYFGRIDYLFNNGGISQRSISIETSIEVDRRIFEINFFAADKLTKAVLPHMLKNGFGHISATSSVVGKFGIPMRSAYAASKHALHGYYDSLRAEMYGKGIYISVIIAGRILTNISQNAVTKDGSKYNKLDEGQANGMTADEAAQRIIKGIAKRKPEIMFGGKELLMVYIRRYLPKLFYYMAPRVKPT